MKNRGEKKLVSSIKNCIPKEKESTENIFEEIMAKNFSYLLKKIHKVGKLSKPQAGKILLRLHLGTSDYSNRDKEKILKTAKKNGTLYIYRGTVIQITMALLEIMEGRALNDIFRTLKENCQTRILCLKKISTMKIKMRHFQVNRN